MAARRVLFLDACGLSAWHVCRGQVRLEDEFAADDDGVRRFAAFLARHQDSVYSLLVDVVEESFQLEDIPPLRGRDRIALIKRKLGRHYPATPFTVALTLGRQESGRGDERMLFAALTRPQQLAPWLSALKDAAAAVAGVFSLPQVVTALPGLGGEHGCFLLITWTRGGLRQTFVQEGRMRFSRLSALGSRAPEEAAAVCAQEAGKIRHYLHSQGLVADDQPLSVRILVHPAQAPAFEAVCRDSPALRYERLPLPEYAVRCGLKDGADDSLADRLFIRLLVRKTPRAQFAHADTRRVFRLGQARFGLRAAAWCTLAACISFAAAKVPSLQAVDQSIRTMQAEYQRDAQRYREIQAARPQSPLAPDHLFELAATYEGLLARSVGPEPTYRRLAAALEDFPEIRLERLAWSIREQADGERGPAPREDDGPYSAADIEGTLPVAVADDPAAQGALIDRFAQRLGADGVLEVRVATLPYDAASSAALTGDGEVPAAVAPRFKLHAIERLKRP